MWQAFGRDGSGMSWKRRLGLEWSGLVWIGVAGDGKERPVWRGLQGTGLMGAVAARTGWIRFGGPGQDGLGAPGSGPACMWRGRQGKLELGALLLAWSGRAGEGWTGEQWNGNAGVEKGRRNESRTKREKSCNQHN